MKKSHEGLIEIVHILNDGHCHDGNALSRALNISRTAVWKRIKKLKEYGVLILVNKRKGYHLQKPLYLLNAVKIRDAVQDVSLEIFESLPSTNDYLKSIQTKHSVVICLAEQQTKGRGRFDRHWHSPFGTNLYLSCLYRFKKDLSELAGLSLVTSLAVLKTLKTYGLQNLLVKWPNDLVCEGKKISGNLIEIQAESHGICSAVIGIGVNVNMTDDSSAITQEWTSMQKTSGEMIDRNELCVRLIKQLIHYLERIDTEGFSSFVNEWIENDVLTNQFIALKNLDQVVRGVVKGVNDRGYLLLETGDGLRAFSSGEASVVKQN
ncbi:MAG: biotin--[acetyl-CoA-carboxylase] ligase [Gammaproteobacteria bacterium RIFCSPHIGHO2_12_FULL_38_14]|nr:MAG: biotin--[acetyl-CoA-carboxylase] ligase [Gammaproteobacteria bacterium RIFCSPHIGHO2_12_FULL_38_14]